MKIAFVGCGFVFDIYLRTIRAHPELTVTGVYDINPERMRRVSAHYGFHTYQDFDALLEDSDVEIVVNLTPIGEHFEVCKRALEAGKHVYSEKPLTKKLEQSQLLFEIAKREGVRLYAAPCNIYSDTVRTMFHLVNTGAVGTPRLIYAELDDNPIHLMEFEKVVSPTGAPWPLKEEIYEGCTYEHLGYHLVWICGLLGPAVSVTAYSSELLENKMQGEPPRVGTPDYSVVNLHFANGASARITCSVVAPRDHRMRIIGDQGEVSSDSYRHYRAPVYLERYSKGSLSARKFQSVRSKPWLAGLFGVGGSAVTLARNPKSNAVEKDQQMRSTLKQRAIEKIRRREVYAQDKFAGIAEMSREISGELDQYLSNDFLMHINELTLLTQTAGPEGLVAKPETTFNPIGPVPNTDMTNDSGKGRKKPKFLEKMLSR